MVPLHIGFTGTRNDLTDKQMCGLEDAFSWIRLIAAAGHGRSVVLHHGDCRGADEYAHYLAMEYYDFLTTIHPPVDDKDRAFCKGAIYEFEPLTYLARNRKIIKHTTMLVATPPTDEEVKRSGSWATIRYGKKAKMPIVLIGPTEDTLRILD